MELVIHRDRLDSSTERERRGTEEEKIIRERCVGEKRERRQEIKREQRETCW